MPFRVQTKNGTNKLVFRFPLSRVIYGVCRSWTKNPLWEKTLRHPRILCTLSSCALAPGASPHFSCFGNFPHTQCILPAHMVSELSFWVPFIHPWTGPWNHISCIPSPCPPPRYSRQPCSSSHGLSSCACPKLLWCRPRCHISRLQPDST